MPLIDFKIHIALNLTKNCVMYPYAAGDDNNIETTFEITNTELYVSIVTLSTKDNVNLTKQLDEGFTRPAYWNKYKSKIDLKDLNNDEATNIRIYPDASFERIKRLFALIFENTDNGDNMFERNSYRKHFLPGVNINNYNLLIDGRNFYDQPAKDQIKDMMKLETLQQDKEIITQQGFC